MKVTNSYLDDFSSDFLSVVVDFLTSDEDFPVDLVGSRLLDRDASVLFEELSDVLLGSLLVDL
jgi:hypothetical protein